MGVSSLSPINPASCSSEGVLQVTNKAKAGPAKNQPPGSVSVCTVQPANSQPVSHTASCSESMPPFQKHNRLVGFKQRQCQSNTNVAARGMSESQLPSAWQEKAHAKLPSCKASSSGSEFDLFWRSCRACGRTQACLRSDGGPDNRKLLGSCEVFELKRSIRGKSRV